jgi:hypothetical protein
LSSVVETPVVTRERERELRLVTAEVDALAEGGLRQELEFNVKLSNLSESKVSNTVPPYRRYK